MPLNFTEIFNFENHLSEFMLFEISSNSGFFSYASKIQSRYNVYYVHHLT